MRRSPGGLVDDRNLIAHDRGLPDASGERRFYHPPAKGSGRSETREWFTAQRAREAVVTAEEAIAALG